MLKFVLHSVILFIFSVFLYSQDAKDSKLSDSIQVKGSSLSKDSVLRSSILPTVQKDTVIPIKNFSLINDIADTRISYDELIMNNFFDLNSQLGSLPGAFYFDAGAPSGVGILSLRGHSFREIGLMVNNRSFIEPVTGTFNLLELSTEEISSIDVITSPRAFLYNTNNEISTLIINEREIYSETPYTRIKYIEAPYDNLYIDGLFNSSLTKRLNLEFDVTKQNTKGRFSNSGFDIWKTKFKLVYLYSNNFNLILNYRYSKSEINMNGGVDIYKINPGTNQTYNDIFYEERLSPVINSRALQTFSKNHIDFELRSDILKGNKLLSFLNFYYSDYSKDFNTGDSVRLHFSKIAGAKFRQYYNLDKFRMEFISTYQQNTLFSFYYPFSVNNEFHSSLLVDFKWTDYIEQAIYLKYSKTQEVSNYSFGIDQNIKVYDNLIFYIGCSSLLYLNYYNELSDNPNLKNYSNKYHLNAKLNYKTQIFDGSVNYYYIGAKSREKGETPYWRYEVKGGSVAGNLKIWKFNLGFTGSYCKIQKQNEPGNNSYPELTASLDLFYRNIHFDNSLDINTGLRLNFFSEYYGLGLSQEKLLLSDIGYIDTIKTLFYQQKIASDYRLDFIVSGKIKNSATVYIAAENITNRKFFMIPYYPVRDFGIRFGIAWELYD